MEDNLQVQFKIRQFLSTKFILKKLTWLDQFLTTKFVTDATQVLCDFIFFIGSFNLSIKIELKCLFLILSSFSNKF
jgi:hypothetical protein